MWVGINFTLTYSNLKSEVDVELIKFYSVTATNLIASRFHFILQNEIVSVIVFLGQIMCNLSTSYLLHDIKYRNRI